MLKNYIIIAINNLLKNKLYSTINIIGLAVGLATCILMTLFVQDQLSYDRKWEKADLIYRVNNKFRVGDLPEVTSSATSVLALPALTKYFHEDIELGTRFKTRNGEIQIGDVRYQGSIFLVDEEFINIFQVEVLKGSLKSTLSNPFNIALSEESATQYFGDREPIGEVITFNKEEQYKVTAVYRFLSSNTSLNVSNFSLLDEAKIDLSWNSSGFGYFTYVRFSEAADIDNIVERLPTFIDQIIPVDNVSTPPPGKKLSDVRSYSLQKMSDIYFNPVDSPFPSQLKIVITVFMIISVLVLIIGCINFIILTTAKATQRAREVAMRKVVGARFKQLLFQFLGESMLLALIAFVIAVAMTELALPFFESLVYTDLTVPYASPGSYIFVLLLLIFVGLLGGLYPALVLSRFSPARALKANQTSEAAGSFKLRNILVVLQFTVSIVLIIASVVVYFQLHYTSNHDPGFNPNKLLVVEVWNNNQNIKTLQQELLKIPTVTNIGLSSVMPLVGGGFSWSTSIRPKTDDSTPGQSISIDGMYVDYYFFETHEIPLLAGRYFTQGMDYEEPSPISSTTPPDDNKEIHDKRIMINLSAARQMGFASDDEAVGKILEQGVEPYGYNELKVIGVVADSQYRNLRLKPAPEIYHLSPDTAWSLTVRYQDDYQSVVEEVRRIWHAVVGDITFRDYNLKQNLTTTFILERQENKALITAAMLSVFIACLGLFGMASFTVDRRVKEIGLRKAMGAKVRDIVKLLGWQFLKPVLIANIVAWPIAIFAMQSWLERFPYRFDSLLMIPICLGSGLLALVIAWFTVAGNTSRVAKSNPIHALRYE